jgi:hypothetical protein
VFVKEEQTDASFQFHLPVDSLSCQVSLYGSFCASGSGSRPSRYFGIKSNAGFC